MTPVQSIRAILAQARTELVLTLRRGESVLVTLIIPTGLLIFFASARVLPGSARNIAFLLPGTLALAVVASGLVSLGIATAYERYYGVLKLLGVTPFPRYGLVAAKILSVLAVELAQALTLIVISIAAYGWRPHGSIPLAVLAVLLGTAAFSGLGLAMAGALRAEATLALSNGLFLFFVLLGGLYVPLDHLPGVLEPIARVLPAFPLGDVLRASLQGHDLPAGSTLVLVLWAVLSPLIAIGVFKWE